MHTRQIKAMHAQSNSLKFELKKYPKHVAFLFKGSKLLAMSTNSWGKHAEIGLLPFLKNNKQCTMYVKRIGDCNYMSRPCIRCSMSIKHVSPKTRVFYTNAHGEWVEDVHLNNAKKSRSDQGQPSRSLRFCVKRK
tara:strand:- start:528 stop:932 length:405 start_codon:yes stop_codon:yes gene_type:complete